MVHHTMSTTGAVEAAGLSNATNSLRGADVREAKVRLPRRSVLLHRALALHPVSVLGNRDVEALGELRRIARPREAVRVRAVSTGCAIAGSAWRCSRPDSGPPSR